ncbi:helix-turn-helix transcriptional regulator [bacterium]|nr:helix-turn-helix transcriptional regulator [bacterium]
MDNRILLGRRIKELRQRKGLKQEQLAEMVQLEPTSICNIENGRNYPSFQNLEKIINVLGVSFIEVFKFDQHQDRVDLMAEITNMLNNNPEKVQDTYKIVKALVE